CGGLRVREDRRKAVALVYTVQGGDLFDSEKTHFTIRGNENLIVDVPLLIDPNFQHEVVVHPGFRATLEKRGELLKLRLVVDDDEALAGDAHRLLQHQLATFVEV